VITSLHLLSPRRDVLCMCREHKFQPMQDNLLHWIPLGQLNFVAFLKGWEQPTLSSVRCEFFFRNLNLAFLILNCFKNVASYNIANSVLLSFQFIASAPTLFPADYVKEFQSCLDKTPPVSFDKIKAIIVEDLGRPLEEVYEYIDPEPLASASVAQVWPEFCSFSYSDFELFVKVLELIC
jgi:hypothetical protein